MEKRNNPEIIDGKTKAERVAERVAVFKDFAQLVPTMSDVDASAVLGEWFQSLSSSKQNVNADNRKNGEHT